MTSDSVTLAKYLWVFLMQRRVVRSAPMYSSIGLANNPYNWRKKKKKTNVPLVREVNNHNFYVFNYYTRKVDHVSHHILEHVSFPQPFCFLLKLLFVKFFYYLY